MMPGAPTRCVGHGRRMLVCHCYNRREPIGLLGLIGAMTLALVCFGCGSRSGAGLPLVAVEGTVTLDGQPLAGALVTFMPVGDTRGSGGTGYTDQNGRYKLQSAGGGQGVPAGEYRVTINKLVMPDGSDYLPEAGVAPMDSPAQEKLPAQYSDLQRTTLQARVAKPGVPIDFSLSSAAMPPARR